MYPLRINRSSVTTITSSTCVRTSSRFVDASRLTGVGSEGMLLYLCPEPGCQAYQMASNELGKTAWGSRMAQRTEVPNRQALRTQ